MTTSEKEVVNQHQRNDWEAGRKWVCRCNLCQEVRREEREQDKLLVRGVDYVE